MYNRIIPICFLLSVLCLTACMLDPQNVSESKMKEYDLVINKIFYIEDTGGFYIDYSIQDIGHGETLYEDYDGNVHLNLIHYITNLDAADFVDSADNDYAHSIYSKNKRDLPSDAIFDRDKMIYIYTDEEGGGLPGLVHDEVSIATAKARIRQSSLPIAILNSAAAYVTLSATKTPGETVRLYEIKYSDEDLILFDTSDGAWAYYLKSDTWKKIFNTYVVDATKNLDTIYLLNDGYMYESADKGVSWEKTTNYFFEGKRFSHFCRENDLICIIYGKTLAVSADSGGTWTEHPDCPSLVSDMALFQQNIFLHTVQFQDDDVFMSSDRGSSWIDCVIDPIYYEEFISSGNYLYIAAEGYIHRFSNGKFSKLELPTPPSGLIDYYESNDIFMYQLWPIKGYCFNLNMNGNSPWYFLEKDSMHVYAERVIGDQLVFTNNYKLELYDISALNK